MSTEKEKTRARVFRIWHTAPRYFTWPSFVSLFICLFILNHSIFHRIMVGTIFSCQNEFVYYLLRSIVLFVSIINSSSFTDVGERVAKPESQSARGHFAPNKCLYIITNKAVAWNWSRMIMICQSSSSKPPKPIQSIWKWKSVWLSNQHW